MIKKYPSLKNKIFLSHDYGEVIMINDAEEFLCDRQNVIRVLKNIITCEGDLDFYEKIYDELDISKEELNIK